MRGALHISVAQCLQSPNGTEQSLGLLILCRHRCCFCSHVLELAVLRTRSMHASHARQCNSMHSRAFGELNCKNKSSSSIYFEIYHRRLVGSTMCPLSEYVRLRFVLITCANSLMVDLNSDHPPRFISHPFPCQSSPFKWRYCASTRIILSAEYPLPTAAAAVAHQY